MGSNKIMLILLMVFLGFTLIHVVYGADYDFDLPSVPQQLANRMGMSLFAGQILMSVITISLFTLPVLFLTKGKNIMVSLVIGILAMGFCVAIGWLGVWILLVVILFIGLLFASKAREWLTGANP